MNIAFDITPENGRPPGPLQRTFEQVFQNLLSEKDSAGIILTDDPKKVLSYLEQGKMVIQYCWAHFQPATELMTAIEFDGKLEIVKPEGNSLSGVLRAIVKLNQGGK